MKTARARIVFFFQIASLMGIWFLFMGIVFWLANSMKLAIEFHDAPRATLGITVLAMLVFITLAGVLTYVFVGLQLGKKKE